MPRRDSGASAPADGQAGASIVGDLLNALPRLRGLAGRLTGNESDAHDLVQVTCLRILERVSGLRRGGPEESEALFARIMRNLHVDGIRKRRPPVPIPEEGLAAPSETAIPLWRRIPDELLASVASGLPRPHQEIWSLSFDRRMNHRQIASVLQLRTGTVATRIHRARQRMRTSLRQALLGEDAGALD